MTQLEIDEAVAANTGESIREIRRRGFVIADQFRLDDYLGAAPQIVDWDELDSQRMGLFP